MESNPKPTPDEEPVDASKLHIWQIQAVRDVLLVATVLAILWLGYAMSAITVPFTSTSSSASSSASASTPARFARRFSAFTFSMLSSSRS